MSAPLLQLRDLRVSFGDTEEVHGLNRSIQPGERRALVGLPIHLIDIQSDTDLLLKTMEATEAAGVKVLGACSDLGSCGVDEKHETAMRRYRENLCQTR